jgi:alkylhydroperoxidase family enzyme
MGSDDTTDATAPTPGTGFLRLPAPSDAVRRMHERDQTDQGYVMNLTRVWAHHPALKQAFMDLIGEAADAGSLTVRERGILVTACASTIGDSYCSLAWGGKLAAAADPEISATVLGGQEDGLDARELALARWSRRVAGDANGTTHADVDELRGAGFDDAAILAVTAFVGLRLAFSTINGALGIRPDHELLDRAPEAVVAAVGYGRPVSPPWAASARP